MMKRVFCFVLALILILPLAACRLLPLPEKQIVIDTFKNNRGDVEIVAAFLSRYGSSGARITSADGTYTIVSERHTIKDESVNAAIKRLLSSGAYVAMGLDGSTVYFEQHRHIVEESCGVMRSTGDWPAAMTYMIEKEKITDDGWYYYVDDYNTWRVMQQNKEKPLDKEYYCQSDFTFVTVGETTYQDVCEKVTPQITKYTDYGAYCTFKVEGGGTILIKFTGEELVVSGVTLSE